MPEVPATVIRPNRTWLFSGLVFLACGVIGIVASVMSASVDRVNIILGFIWVLSGGIHVFQALSDSVTVLPDLVILRSGIRQSLHRPEDILRGRKTRFRFFVDDTRVHMPATLHFPGVAQVIEQSMRRRQPQAFGEPGNSNGSNTATAMTETDELSID